MSPSGDGKFYVVFEGRRPGIYNRWVDAAAQVLRFKGNRHKSFETYAEAEYEWLRYCNEHGRWNSYTQRQMHRNKDAASSSAHVTESKVPNVAEDTSSDVFILQHSMQKQLVHICQRLHIEEPDYKLYEVKVINGCEYQRYYGCVCTGAIGKPAVSIGKFAKDEYDAKEDVAAILIRRLLTATGRKIRDFNHYNVQLLEEQLQKVVDEKSELELEIVMLNEEMRHMKCTGSSGYTETSSSAE